MKNSKVKHQKLPESETNDSVENENDNNYKIIKISNRKTDYNLEIKQENNKKIGNMDMKSKKRFLNCIKICFIILIVICFAIIFALVNKDKLKNNSDNDNVQSLIELNTDSRHIFETNDYYLVEKIGRQNKVFTQGLFFDTDTTLIESTGLYGKSKLRRFGLKTPDMSLYENNLDMNYFSEGACIYKNKYIFQLTWREKVV